MLLNEAKGLCKEIADAFRNVFSLANSKSNPIKNLFHADMLADELPYIYFDEINELFVNKNSVGFAIEVQPPVGINDQLSRDFDTLFEEILEEGDSIQILMLADHRIQPFLNFWENGQIKKADLFQELTQKRADYFCKISSCMPKNFRLILSYSNKTKTKEGLEKLVQKKEKLKKMLELSIPIRIWHPEDLINHIQGFSSFNGDKEFVRKKWNTLSPLNIQLKGKKGLIKVKEDGLEFIEEKTTYAFKSFEVIDFPEQCNWHVMQELLGSNFRDSLKVQHPFYIQYGIHCPPQDKLLTQFEKRSYLVGQQGRFSHLRRLIPSLEEELYDINLIRKGLGNRGKIVWAQLSAGIWSPQSQMPVAEQALMSIFGSKDMELAETKYFHLPQLLSSFPMSFSEYTKDLQSFGCFRTTINQECKHMMPFTAEWKGTRTPGMFLMGRKGQTINWNPFDNQSGNYNVVVVGRSGSGKSVFMQDLLMNGLRTGARVFVFDVGRSFEKICSMFEGQFIEFSKDSKICLNPFSKIPLHDEEEIEANLALIKPIICSMTSPIKGVTEHENGLIPKAIKSVWNQKKNKATISDIALWLENQEDQVAKSLGIRLHPYTKEGSYGKFFEGENNIDLQNRMVVIELEELKEKKELQSVILQFFVMTITNIAFLGDRKTPFYICIDEAWDLLRGKETGDFIQTLARRLRKYNGSLVVGTQNVDDFFSSPAASAAFENSDWMCALPIKTDAIASLAEKKRFIVSEGHRKALESLVKMDGMYSEIMICDANSKFFVTRLYLDPFSQFLYSSKPDDFFKINALRQKGMTVTQAINHLLEERK
jgi:conjugal transfer ATP-binding protein TraC